MPCYFLSVTGLLLSRTDIIFRQSVIFKLMVSLKISPGFHCYSRHSSLLSLTLTQQRQHVQADFQQLHTKGQAGL